jgi:hypothetical protein
MVRGIMTKLATYLDTHYPPVRFGCEFSFVPKKETYDKRGELTDNHIYMVKNKASRLKHKYIHAYEDQGALEVPSPVFTSYTECLSYWTRLKRAALPFRPTYPGVPGGGLHIRVDIAKRDLIPLIWRLCRYSEVLKGFNEPGDTESARPLEAKVFETLHNNDMGLKIVPFFKHHTTTHSKSYVVAYDPMRKAVEFRGFDSPNTSNELLLSILLAQLLMSPLPFFRILDHFETLVGATLHNLLASTRADTSIYRRFVNTFKRRFAAHDLSSR